MLSWSADAPGLGGAEQLRSFLQPLTASHKRETATLAVAVACFDDVLDHVFSTPEKLQRWLKALAWPQSRLDTERQTILNSC